MEPRTWAARAAASAEFQCRACSALRATEMMRQIAQLRALCDGALPRTREFFRRHGALHALESQGFYRRVSGRAHCPHQKGIERSAVGSYGVPEAEFRRCLKAAVQVIYKTPDGTQRTASSIALTNLTFLSPPPSAPSAGLCKRNTSNTLSPASRCSRCRLHDGML